MTKHLKTCRRVSIDDENGKPIVELRFDPPISYWEASHRIQEYYREWKAAQ